jgi:hypothetical protein
MNNIDENTAYDVYKKVYYSDIVGSPIVDAITGAKYPFKVGSTDENKFFKVRSTIAYKNRSAKMDYLPCASVTNQAFYESPTAYMDYHCVKLSADIIDKWQSRV